LPINGYLCTSFPVQVGCEHFGFGYYGAPTAIKYNWLIESPATAGTLIRSPAVNIATPAWTYTPAQPKVALPAQVVAKIQAPPPLDGGAPLTGFGEAVWVKAIKTTTHNNNVIELRNLVSEDPNNPDIINWKNDQTAEIEVEWRLMQDELAVPNGANDYLTGIAEDLPIGDETITRRYEFFKYTGPLDPTSNQAECDTLPPFDPAIDPTANPECFILGEAGLKGGYIGAQMAGFNVKAPLGLIDHLQNGEVNQSYPSRSVVIGGNKPYTINVTGPLPEGMAIDPTTGVLSGTPIVAGYYLLNIDAADADGVQVSKGYPMFVVDPATPNSKYPLSVVLVGNGSGQVHGSSNSSVGQIDCGWLCSDLFYSGSTVTLSATPMEGSTFTGWSGDACVGSTATTCNVTMDSAKNVTAMFTLQQYALSVSKSGPGLGTVTGNGIDCGDSCSAILDYGTTVTLTATPTTGSAFTGWSGACSGTAACNVTMDAVKNVAATFIVQQYPLSVSKSGTGSGIVSGNGIDCGVTCSSDLDYGTTVSLSAVPDANSVFIGWSGACTGMSVCNVTIDNAKNVTATFTLQTFMLYVTKTGDGAVTGGQIDCGASCSTVMNAGSSITLTATPTVGNAFVGWSGDCTGSSSTCTVNIDAAKTVSASFVPIKYTLSVSKTNTTYGSVTSNPSGINCGTACSSQFNQGASVTLTATPARSHKFTGWTGACAGTSLTCTVSMTQDKSVNAAFK
jgi:hypothetical protein